MKFPGTFFRAIKRLVSVGPGERLLPVASGLLLTLSFPPFDLLVPPFVALVPFLLFMAERPAGATGRWSAARGGFLMGLVYFGLLLYWLFVALVYYSKLAIAAYALTVLILGIFTATFASALHFVRERTPVPFALAVAALWTAIEWVQGHLGDLSFPWLGLGSAVSAFPRVAGAADLVGARGLTFWLALANGLIATGILAYREGRPVRRIAAAALVTIALPVAYGAWRVETLEVRPAGRVAVVQPNIPEDLKMQQAAAVDSTLTAVTHLMGRIEPGSVDLVVWPEVTLPTVLEYSLVQDHVRRLSALVDAPVVAGAYGLTGDPRGDYTLYNSSFVVTPDGLTGDVYHKKYLVPFVERIPFIDPARLEAIIGDVRYFGGLGRGEEAPAFAAGDARYGILICYESIFAEHSRDFRLQGVDYLVNMTNDAWYGREPWYARTTALWQHPAHLSMRAIEQRVGIARAANTGISMFVDPLGRTYEETELFEPDVRIATVYTTDEITLFARWGDWLATGATLAAALMVLSGALYGGRGGARTGAGPTGARPLAAAGGPLRDGDSPGGVGAEGETGEAGLTDGR
mgnify:FL=1